MLHDQLLALEHDGRPIRIGVVGAGTFGSQIIARASRMVGMDVAVVADRLLPRARVALVQAGRDPSRIAAADHPDEVDRAVEDGRWAITADPLVLVGSAIDVVVEATGHVETAVRTAHAAIMAGKHVCMVTVEADVLVGHRLRELADARGVVYSLAYGDEPALAVELWDWARTLGFRVVAAGKGTRFLPEFRHAGPDDVPRLYGFAGHDYNAQMFGSFLDGTKHAIEMAALANATGLVPDVRGMRFPALELADVPDALSLREKGGQLGSEGVVEVLSAVHADGAWVERHLRGGVYAVFASDDASAIDSMADYGDIIGMIVGARTRQALVYRPQHFVGHEVPIGIARMQLTGRPIAAPIGRIADVVAVAKTDLVPGTILDGEGGRTVYGLIERAGTVDVEELVPIGLTAGAEVLRHVAQDEPLTVHDVRIPDSFAWRMRAESGLAKVESMHAAAEAG